MKPFYLCIGLLLTSGLLTTADAATLYLVRHAEKQLASESNKDPGLTMGGIERARKTALILGQLDFTHIYSSDYQRTRLTAEIMKANRVLPVSIYDPRELAAFAQQLKALPADSVILVVGHSNTTPQLAQMLSGQPVAPIDESIYHNLYRVGLDKDGTSSIDLLTIPPVTGTANE